MTKTIVLPKDIHSVLAFIRATTDKPMQETICRWIRTNSEFLRYKQLIEANQFSSKHPPEEDL